MSDGHLAFLIVLLAAPFWLWAALRVLRDLSRPSPRGGAQSRCGLPAGPCGPCPAALWWRAHRPRMAHHRRHGAA